MPAQRRPEITDRISFANGRSFRAVGVYERLTDRASFAVDLVQERLLLDEDVGRYVELGLRQGRCVDKVS